MNQPILDLLSKILPPEVLEVLKQEGLWDASGIPDTEILRHCNTGNILKYIYIIHFSLKGTEINLPQDIEILGSSEVSLTS